MISDLTQTLTEHGVALDGQGADGER